MREIVQKVKNVYRPTDGQKLFYAYCIQYQLPYTVCKGGKVMDTKKLIISCLWWRANDLSYRSCMLKCWIFRTRVIAIRRWL